MKRIYLILTLIVALGCSKSDSPTTPERNNILHPPEWLYGSYSFTFDEIFLAKHTFSFDDIVSVIEHNPGSSVSYSNYYSNAEGYTVIEEFNGSSSYKFTYYEDGVHPGESQEFVKISNTEIQIIYLYNPPLIYDAYKL